MANIKENSYLKRVKFQLELIHVGQSWDPKEFIIKTWGSYDFFIKRSFDVFVTKARKELEGKLYVSRKGIIYRIK